MRRFNGQGDKQRRINNAARWHWPYFVPFNLCWYFDAQCPCYSLAHRRLPHSLFKAWKKETLGVWQRLHHRHPNDINENGVGGFGQAGRGLCRNAYFHSHECNVNAKCLLDNWGWQLSGCVGGELWEALTGDWGKAAQQPLLHGTAGMITGWQPRSSLTQMSDSTFGFWEKISAVNDLWRAKLMHL